MITVQVHDVAEGKPAARIPIELDYFITGFGWKEVGRGLTDGEGRVRDFAEHPAPGLYRQMFDIAAYGAGAFFPSIPVIFEVRDVEDPVHIHLTISPFGYTAHRGLPE
jgi:5-hydroxyisourate hydrolase